MATKEDLQLEREYQQALKISASSVGGMQKQISDLLNKKRALKKETKDYIKELSSNVASLTDSNSISQQILSNQEEINKLKKGEHELQQGTNKFTKEGTKAAIKALETQNRSLGIYELQQQAIERVNEKAQKVEGQFGGWVDKLSSSASSIPIIGGLVGGMAEKAGNKLKDAFGQSSQKYVAAYGKSLQSGAGHLKSMASGASAAGGSLLKAFMGPQAILLLIVGALAAGFYAIKQFEAGMKAFRQETNLVKGQMDGIEQSATRVGAATMGLSGSIEEGAKIVGQMVAGFGSIERLSDATLMSAAKLSLSYGISADNIAQSNKLFQNLNGLTEEQAQYMTVNVAKMAEINDVSPEKVLKDMNESSAEMYKYFKGSPTQLMKAAVQAQKLGTSLKQSAEVSKSLLNFEDSINSELEASAILGRNINFNEARMKAAKGDTLGAQQAIMREVAKLGDLTKLNVFQQEALAKATGMPLEDLINQQRVKKKIVELSAHDKYLQEQLIKKGIDITKMKEGEARAALENQAIANRNVEASEVLENNMKAMLLGLASAFAPLAQDLMAFLNNNMPQIREFINGTVVVIGGFIEGVRAGFSVISDALQPVKDAFNSLFPEGEGMGFAEILKIVAKVLTGGLFIGITQAIKQFAGLLDIGMGFWKILKGIFGGEGIDFNLIGEGLMQIFSGWVDYIFALPSAIIDIFASIFPNITLFQNLKNGFDEFVFYIKNLPILIWESLKSMGSSIQQWFYDIIPDWAKEFFGIEAPAKGKSLTEVGNDMTKAYEAEKAAREAEKAANSTATASTVKTAAQSSAVASATGTAQGTVATGTQQYGATGYTSGTSFTSGMTPVTISAESFKGTVLQVNNDNVVAKLDTSMEANKHATGNVTQAVSTLGTVTTEKMSETSKAMIAKLEEIRKAVILGTLIEMDGTILTQTVTQRQEAFNRVNFASRLKS